MNLKQKEYAVSRVSEIRKRKVKEAKEKCTTPGVKLSDAAMWQLIRDGRVPLLSDCELGTYYNLKLKDAFDFSEFTMDEILDGVQFSELEKAINAEAQRITDELMLGDAEAVLDAIRQFELSY